MNYKELTTKLRRVKPKVMVELLDALNNVKGIKATITRGEHVLDDVLKVEISTEDKITDELILEIGILIGTFCSTRD